MGGLRTWLRSVRSALYRLKSKRHQPQHVENNDPAPTRELTISAPISVVHDGVDFEPSRAEPVSRTPPIQEFEEPSQEQYITPTPIDIAVTPSTYAPLQLMHSYPSFTTLVEEIEAPPSLHEDSDADTIPGDAGPSTPSSSQRNSRRWSVVHGLSSLSGYPTMTISSRPQSYIERETFATQATIRSSIYSTTSKETTRSKRVSIIQGLGSLSGYPTMTMSPSPSRPQSYTDATISPLNTSNRTSFYSTMSNDSTRSKRTSLIHGLSSLSGYPGMTMPLSPRPQSYITTNPLSTHDEHRASFYSGIDVDTPVRDTRPGVPNHSALRSYQRTSALASKRGSVRTECAAYSVLSGTEWENRRFSNRFSRWMNQDMEGVETHVNPYAPL
jgi:hypothetical protein